MKISMAFNGLGYGGVEKIGSNYAKLFIELGYEVDVYNLNPKRTEMENQFPKECRIIRKNLSLLQVPGYYILLVKKYSWGKYVYPFIYLITSLILQIKKLLWGKRKQYDIAIAFSGHLRDMTFVADNFVKSDKKVCWVHGAIIGNLATASTYGDLYKKIKNVVVLSDYMQNLAISGNRKLEGINIKKIYNPMVFSDERVDIGLCSELKEKFGDYILMVGRFENDKDQKTVIKARKILEEKYNIKPKLVFVGDGSTLKECRKYAAGMGLSDDVVFVGARQDVQNFYTSARLFVHSSPAEGLPTVLLESMNYGLPIVATDSPPGVSEILQNDKYGLKCEVANPYDMAEKISILFADDQKRNTYIEAGKKRLDAFSFENIGKSVKGLFSDLI